MIDPIHVVFVLEQVVLVNVLNLELIIFSAACYGAVLVIEGFASIYIRKAPRTDWDKVVRGQFVITWRHFVANSKLADVHLRYWLQKLVTLSSTRISLTDQILQNGKLFGTPTLLDKVCE